MKYEPPVGGAANDPYVNGDKSTGTEGSIPPAEAIEHPMREIVNVITQMGITPDGADLTQLFAAMSRMSARVVTTVTSGGSPYDLTLAAAGLVLVDASGGDVTLNLPAAANKGGLRYVVARTDSSANIVTVNPDGTGPDTIEGVSSASLGVSRRLVLVADGVDDWKSPVLIATDAEARAYSSGKLIDGAALAAAFSGSNFSALTAGYQKLPGGLMMQWGVTGTVPAGTTIALNYPIAFPNDSFVVVGSCGVPGGTPNLNFTGFTSSQYKVENSSTTSGRGGAFFAFGH